MKINGNVSSKGDVAGTIYNQGLNIDEFITALKQAFPKDDPRPEQLRKLLKKFHQHNYKLREWKELHNTLDEILSAFGQFNIEIQRADAENKLPQVKSLRNLWRAVSMKIDALEVFGRSIRFIGTPFREEERVLRGEEWVVQISAKRNEINKQLGLGNNNSGEIDYYPKDNVFWRGQFRLGLKPAWWINLFELTNDFNHLVYGHMHLTDKRLRDSANELFALSRSIFGS